MKFFPTCAPLGAGQFDAFWLAQPEPGDDRRPRATINRARELLYEPDTGCEFDVLECLDQLEESLCSSR